MSTGQPQHRACSRTTHADSSTQQLRQHLLSFSKYLLLTASISKAFPWLLVVWATSGCLSLALPHFTFQENRTTQGSAQVTCSSQIHILCHLPIASPWRVIFKMSYVCTLPDFNEIKNRKFYSKKNTQSICCKIVWANNFKILQGHQMSLNSIFWTERNLL